MYFVAGQQKISMATTKGKSPAKNKLNVKNSLLNNINARKKKCISRTKSRSAISKKSYDDMEHDWEEKK